MGGRKIHSCRRSQSARGQTGAAMAGRGKGPKDVSSITAVAARLFSAVVGEQVCQFMKSE